MEAAIFTEFLNKPRKTIFLYKDTFTNLKTLSRSNMRYDLGVP